MFAKSLCQKYFNKSLTGIHSTRAQALFDVSWALTGDAKLTLSSLGRNLEGDALVKHKIKRVDRLLGNEHLRGELNFIYKDLTNPILSVLNYCLLAVDWSGYDKQDFHIIRASLLFNGRSIPIYEQVYSQKELGTQEAHERFLEGLQFILPSDKPIIVVTDAGFSTPWFQMIHDKGWYFIGRAKLDLKLYSDSDWHPLREYEPTKEQKAKYIKSGLLGKRSETAIYGHIYTYKDKAKGRKGCSRYPDVNKRHSKQNSAGWVIISNIPGKQSKANMVINMYKRRMQIEQNFRDDKNARYGYGLRYINIKNKGRLSIYVLLASIATLFLWWIGYTGEQLGLERNFRANTSQGKRALSFIFLAKQMLKHGIKFSLKELSLCARTFISLYNNEIETFVDAT